MIKVSFPHPPGSGGPGSFQRRFEEALVKSNYKINYSYQSQKSDIVIIVGGTRRLFWLLKKKIMGVPILYRLDGIQWLHKKQFKKVGIKKYLVNEVQNLMSKFVQAFLADHIVYQSQFVKDWWQREQWFKRSAFSIIHNAVDLNTFYPMAISVPAKISQKVRIVFLEGHLDYSPYAIDLINKVSSSVNYAPVEVYGNFSNSSVKMQFVEAVNYKGMVAREQLPSIFRGSIYVSLDIHAACPNTVIEALASGAPVVGLDTGALKELVANGSGIVVPYGANAWELEMPDYNPLFIALKEVFQHYDEFSERARALAVRKYSMVDMFKKYEAIIDNCIHKS